MKPNSIILFALLTINTLFGQTIINHNSEIYGNWQKSNSPYIIQGNAIIPNGKNLTINEGVEIILSGNEDEKYSKKKALRGNILVNGILTAKGNTNEKIVFKSSDDKEYWGTICFKESSGSSMDYCVIQNGGGVEGYADQNIDAVGAITIYECAPAFNNIVIMNSEKTGVLVTENSKPIFTNSTITNSNDYGIISFKSDPIFNNCNIIFNLPDNFSISKGYLTMNNSILWGNIKSTECLNLVIKNSIIERGDFIYKFQYLKNNNIIGPPTSNPQIENELFNNSLYGITENINGVQQHIGINEPIPIQTVNTIDNNIVTNQDIKSSDVPKQKADIDINIPQNTCCNNNRYALIIGNEDYTKFQSDLGSEVNVDFARNDAEVFAQYCINTLGVPKDNLTLLKDCIGSQLEREINKLSKIAQYSEGKAEIIFYYAGHGAPHEQTKEEYIMPVDISGSDIENGIKLSWIYQKLTENNPAMTIVFLDACFSGGARNQGLFAARAVKVKPKESTVQGNCIVFASSSGEQSSLAFKENQHGMFTYFLLKKLQETSGNVTAGELSQYLYENVAINSLKYNSKEQTPVTLSSEKLYNSWKEVKLFK